MMNRRSKWFVNSSTALFRKQVGKEDLDLHDTIMTAEVLEDSDNDISEEGAPCTSIGVVTDVQLSRSASKASIKSLQEQLDLEREKTKMESFDCYILVSVLTATSSFSTLQSFELLADTENSTVYYILLIATQLASGVSTICGLYATIVFSLTVLYAKSAIGLGKDHIYQYFMKETASVRVRGFQAFSASLLAFALEAGLVTFLRVPAVARAPVLLLVSCLLHFLCRDWQCIVDTATVIYTGKIPNSSKSKEE